MERQETTTARVRYGYFEKEYHITCPSKSAPTCDSAEFLTMKKRRDSRAEKSSALGSYSPDRGAELSAMK